MAGCNATDWTRKHEQTLLFCHSISTEDRQSGSFSPQGFPSFQRSCRSLIPGSLAAGQAFCLRQASRRSWRIGQTKPCRIVYFYYDDTMQSRAMALMGRKLTAAQALEGKFSSEGLAALAGDDTRHLRRVGPGPQSGEPHG
jgi:hypothetical protein